MDKQNLVLILQEKVMVSHLPTKRIKGYIFHMQLCPPNAFKHEQLGTHLKKNQGPNV